MSEEKRRSAHMSTLRKALAATDSHFSRLAPRDEGELELLAAASSAEYKPLDVLLQTKSIFEDVIDERPLTDRVFINLAFERRDSLAGGFFDGCQFISANLSYVSLRKAHLRRTVFVGVELKGADLSEAQVDDSKMAGHKFEGVTLNNTSFERALMQGCEFQMCRNKRLERVSFRGADLTAANFANLLLEDVNMEGATARGVLMKGVRMRGCTLRSAGFSGAVMAGGSIEACVMDYADFLWSVLSDCQIMGEPEKTPARFANFTRAELAGAKLSRLDLTGADFSGVDLQSTRFTDCILVGARFRSTHLGPDTVGPGCVLGAPVIDPLTVGEEFLKV